jgi:aryl-alcohol dehydrogenase-like predicted oxidoreductase
MKYREFGRTGWRVSEVSFGAWAIGGSWGHVPEEDAIQALHTSIDRGVNLIDTADVYGDGRSEKIIRTVLSQRTESVYVATKAGRRLQPHLAAGYNRKNLNAFVERSLLNLGVEALDLVQLHCPPTETYYTPEVFGIMDDLIHDGKIRYYGVSVEKVDEAIKAIEFPNVQSVQIIFNLFRQRPAEVFLPMARQKKVAVLARVPLASGLLSGKMRTETTFAEDDHRNFNRHGEAFDVGETFSGVDYVTGLEAVEKIRPLVSGRVTMAQFALKWILMSEEVTCVIPGARNSLQAIENAETSDQPSLSSKTLLQCREIYAQLIRDQVHHRW